MRSIPMTRISEAINNLSLPSVDLIVGIATGGTVPASLLAYRLGVEMRMLPINYRDEDNEPRYEEPQLVGPQTMIPDSANHILLVDDVSVTGRTMDYARNLLPDIPTTTLVLKGSADLVLLPEIKECVHWPWNVHNRKDKEESVKMEQIPNHNTNY